METFRIDILKCGSRGEFKTLFSRSVESSSLPFDELVQFLRYLFGTDVIIQFQVFSV